MRYATQFIANLVGKVMIKLWMPCHRYQNTQQVFASSTIKVMFSGILAHV